LPKDLVLAGDSSTLTPNTRNWLGKAGYWKPVQGGLRCH
jgi:hypothetical protein